METKPDTLDNNYLNLLNCISDTYANGRRKAIQDINSNMVVTYWKIGQYIVEFEQGGNIKAKYGKALLENLLKDLFREHGKGFSLSNMKRMRQFYVTFQISAELPHKLSWTHCVELLKINNLLERSYYKKQTIPGDVTLKAHFSGILLY